MYVCALTVAKVGRRETFMRPHFLPAAVAAAAAVLLAANAFAAAPRQAQPLFIVVPPNVPWHTAAPVRPTGRLTQWNGSFTDRTGKTVTYTMVGTDPSTTNITSTIPVVIIPVKMIY